MKITETITPTNADKTIMGRKEITLTFDTETREVGVSLPAMWKIPTIFLDELMSVLDKFDNVSKTRE